METKPKSYKMKKRETIEVKEYILDWFNINFERTGNMKDKVKMKDLKEAYEWDQLTLSERGYLRYDVFALFFAKIAESKNKTYVLRGYTIRSESSLRDLNLRTAKIPAELLSKLINKNCEAFLMVGDHRIGLEDYINKFGRVDIFARNYAAGK